jgi:hypothetical protein
MNESDINGCFDLIRSAPLLDAWSTHQFMLSRGYTVNSKLN